MIEEMLPNNVNAEIALIGSILIDPEAFVLVNSFLDASDFYRDAHRMAYEAMTYIVDRQERPDLITLSDELARRHVRLSPDESNDEYLIKSVNRVPTSGNAELYGHMIEDAAVRRRLLNAAGVIAATAQHNTAEEALELAEEQIFAVAQKRQVSTYASISDVISRCASRLEIVSQKRGTLIGVPTGFIDLDRILGGLHKKALYILAARPKLGKTSFALNIAYHAATHGHKVAIFSLEMADEELGDRLISMEAGIDSQRLQQGWIEDAEWERVERVMSEISESQMVIDETGGLSIAQLRSRCRQIKARQGLDLIVVDYLQLLTAKKDGRPLENRVQEISEISRQLKALAKEMNVPVLALSQLSRKVDDRQNKIPQLSDLRESGSIEQDADCVMFIYRDVVYNPDTANPKGADIIVAKHRAGREGEVNLHFEPSQTKFFNIEVRPAQENDATAYDQEGEEEWN